MSFRHGHSALFGVGDHFYNSIYWSSSSNYNGNQKIEGCELYQTKKNIGCAGGFNLICYIAFEYLGLEKIIIGQEDTIVEEKEMEELLEKCNENTIMGLIKPHFDLATFALHKKTFIKIGMFDENCIDGYCEDADYKQRCYLNGVKIENAKCITETLVTHKKSTIDIVKKEVPIT